MPKTVTIKGKDYVVSLESEEDEGNNKHEFMLLKNGNDERRLSPNTTDEELEAYNDDKQIGYDL